MSEGMPQQLDELRRLLEITGATGVAAALSRVEFLVSREAEYERSAQHSIDFYAAMRKITETVAGMIRTQDETQVLFIAAAEAMTAFDALRNRQAAAASSTS